MPAELVAKIPFGLPYEVATAFPMIGLTAMQCFKRVPIPQGAPLFITGGAGGVGTTLIKLLLANNNTELYTTAGSKESRARLIDLGVRKENIINYQTAEIITELRSKMNKRYFDYVIDLVGQTMSEICAELLSNNGTYVDVTSLVTAKAREVLFDKATSVFNIANYAYASEGKLSYYGGSLDKLFYKVGLGKLTPAPIQVVSKLSVETVQLAHRLIESNQTKGQKQIMIIDHTDPYCALFPFN